MNNDIKSSNHQRPGSSARIDWDERGIPYSALFQDKYFCSDNGKEESFHVCCQGNRLSERFAGLPHDKPGTFTIIETGFGTGLDFCGAWQLWDQCAPRSWVLRFISIELFPLSADQVARALSLWPSLTAYKEKLVSRYAFSPGGRADLHFDDARVKLSIVFDHVVKALGGIKELDLAPDGADAWFLDGFAPSKNPEMWSDKVFAGMVPLSRPGTTFSTFTVAGFVRRGLEAQGFVVTKVPGHGKKKQILTGVFSEVVRHRA
jgi:tRNA 5-methylaminomethyl-2-thiouridine biosynthesis bifunctional protein